jgi:DNA polymerase-1
VILGLPFREIWCVDFEYVSRPGETPDVVAMVAKEVGSGRVIKLWHDQLGPEPPFPVDDGVLFVTYYASAEVGCFLQLGWPIPTRIIDLYAEFRREVNGLPVPTLGDSKYNLLCALSWHHLAGITSREKKAGRDLVMAGGPWTDSERRQILDYCETDVVCLPALLEAMKGVIAPTTRALGQSLLRGRYGATVARMERVGVPIDTDMLEIMRANWAAIKLDLIREVDTQYGVYEGDTFKIGRFLKYLADRGIAWPRTETGQLELKDKVFREQTKIYPELEPLRQLRHALSELRLENLAVGRDGRNRCMLSPLVATSGRNQPSNTKFIFGPAVWIRGLIRPPEGWALAYIDWSAQELSIAAYLSGDLFLLDTLQTEDPYIAFAKKIGRAPEGATEDSHPDARSLCKTLILGSNYGMGRRTLAERTGVPLIEAEALLRGLARAYPMFTEWQGNTVDAALLRGYLSTCFGWRVNVTEATKPNAIKNWPMQAHGSELLRVACMLGTERGIRIVAPVHDAVLIEAPADQIDDAVSAMRGAMAEAVVAVLGPGAWIDTTKKIVRWPDRYRDKRDKVMWERVQQLLQAQPKKSWWEVRIDLCTASQYGPIRTYSDLSI